MKKEGLSKNTAYTLEQGKKIGESESRGRAAILSEELFSSTVDFETLLYSLVKNYAKIPSNPEGPHPLIADLDIALELELRSAEPSESRAEFLDLLSVHLQKYYLTLEANLNSIAAVKYGVQREIEDKVADVQFSRESNSWEDTAERKIYRGIDEKLPFKIPGWGIFFYDSAVLKEKLKAFVKNILDLIDADQKEHVSTSLSFPLIKLLEQELGNVARRGHEGELLLLSYLHQNILKESARAKNLDSTTETADNQHDGQLNHQPSTDTQSIN